MRYIAKFDHPKEYKMILRDSFRENIYFGVDDFDCKYLKIIQAKFGCLNSFHTIPDRVKMEMAPFEWNEKTQKFVLEDKRRQSIQLNQLEIMIISHTLASV
jgi:hypothetical protein